MKPLLELLTPLNRFHKQSVLVFLTLAATAAFFVLPAPLTLADTASDIQQKINEQNEKIAALEKEIAQYERTLEDIGGTKKTLQNEVSRIDVSRKKIGASISVTENKVNNATLQLKRLGGAIQDKASRIVTSTHAIEESLRALNEIGGTTIIEHFLSSEGALDAWVEADRIGQLGTALKDEVTELKTTKESLTVDYSATEKEKAKLISLRQQLKDQKVLLDQNRAEQAALLSQTKNKESEYQKLLAAKQAAKAEFERQLSEFESSLKYSLDVNSIPRAGSGVLSFPIDSSFMSRCKNRVSIFKNVYCLTQYFGNTAFAQSGAYKGSPHNGVDFGTPTGTKIIAALSGTVEATGNTDAATGCYSYGKWVLVRHGNGLSTLYAHLSIISVSKGETVATGGLLGYSGKTGYATGPHLHFTLYATGAVQVIRMKDIPGRTAKTACDSVYVPAAGKSGYLDPMQYL